MRGKTHTIQKTICRQLRGKNYSLVVENVFLYDWESDVLGVDWNDKVHEFEVKISKQDFKSDYEKFQKIKNLTNAYGCNTFSFVCPDGLISVDEIPDYAGLHYYQQRGLQKRVIQIKKPPTLHDEPMDAANWKELCMKLTNKKY